ncbi:MAG: hypothetical protein WCT51_04915 [Candidatus Shapirobacteria bacterium]|jgi:hypothetical protein
MKREDLSPMLLVSVEIYKLKLENKNTTYKDLKERLPNIKVMDAINKCMDLGSIIPEWVEINAEKWDVKYNLYGSETENFIQKICLDLGEIKIEVIK